MKRITKAAALLAGIFLLTGCTQPPAASPDSEGMTDTAPLQTQASTEDTAPETAAATEVPTETTAAETTAPEAPVEETYQQEEPVQTWQTAYAQVMQSSTASQFVGRGCLIHLDVDAVPELLILDHMESGMAGLYSFDGTESYFVGYFNMGDAERDVHYRPYLMMLGYDRETETGSSYNYVVTFGNDENGRLTCTGEVQLNSDGLAPEIASPLPDREYSSVSNAVDLAFYDAPKGKFGETWQVVNGSSDPDSAVSVISDAQIRYWLGNGSTDAAETQPQAGETAD